MHLARVSNVLQQPTVLLTTTLHLPSTTRLAISLRQAGFRVIVAAPPRHPARHTKAVSACIGYAPLQPARGLERAIMRYRPEMVMPCDDRALLHLHRLHAETRQRSIRDLIEASLGPAESFRVTERRHDLLQLAQSLGVRVPETKLVRDVGDLHAWDAAEPFPWVLKADGSWAGHGVRIVTSAEVADAAFHDLSHPVNALRAFRETLVEGDPFWISPFLSRNRPTISVQRYIDGRPANCGVACWDGTVLAMTSVEVVQAESRTGASTVVRVVSNAEMRTVAEKIVATLRLSGLIGLDFMIEAATGHAYLIEMNARCTPICPVPLGPGRDLVEALTARRLGREERVRPPVTDKEVLVFFPHLWEQDPASPYLRTGYHDVPWDEPDLVRALLRPNIRERYWFTRNLRPAWRLLRQLVGDVDWVHGSPLQAESVSMLANEVASMAVEVSAPGATTKGAAERSDQYGPAAPNPA